MKNAFLIFLMVQFLNVQIQTAWGSEGIREVARSEAEGALLSRLESRLEGLNERRRMRLAYRLFKLNIQLRNRVLHMSEDEVQARLEQNPAQLSEKEIESDSKVAASQDAALAEELASLEGLDVLSSSDPGLVLPETHSLGERMSRASILAQSDQLLESLGAFQSDSGHLTKISFHDFKSQILKDAGKTLLKVILSLIVLTLGLSIITVAFIYLIVYSIAGVVTTSAWFYLLLFGTLIAMFFGIRAIIRSSNETSPLPIRVHPEPLLAWA